MSIYLRVKRKKQTLFVMIDPSATGDALKEKVAKILEQEVAKIKLFNKDKKTVIEGGSSLSDMKIENEQIVYLVYASGDGFENIEAEELKFTASVAASKS